MNKNRINIRQPVDLNGPLKPLSTPLSLPPHLHLKWSLNCLKQTVSFQQVAEPHFFRLLKEKKKKEKKRYTDATYCGWQCCPPSAALNAPLLEPPSLTLTLSLTLSLSLSISSVYLRPPASGMSTRLIHIPCAPSARQWRKHMLRFFGL